MNLVELGLVAEMNLVVVDSDGRDGGGYVVAYMVAAMMMVRW